MYSTPDDAWGLDVWNDGLSESHVRESLAIHDEFYGELAAHLDRVTADGPFLVLDVHSYNHRRRAGPNRLGRLPTIPRSTSGPARSIGHAGARWLTGSVESLAATTGRRPSAGRPCERALPGRLPVSLGRLSTTRAGVPWRSSSRRCSWTSGPAC